MTTNDRQLLELAAKAACIKIGKSPYNGGGYSNTGFDVMGNAVLDWNNNIRWNPLTDDGDAFRLRVKLNMNVYSGARKMIAEIPSDGDEPNICVSEDRLDDPCGATRRAIVRAAALVGEMK